MKELNSKQSVPRNVVTSVKTSPNSLYINPPTQSSLPLFTVKLESATSVFVSVLYSFATMQLLFFSLPPPPSQPFLLPILIFFFFFLVMLLLLLPMIHQWRHPNGKSLPPGSMGWPYIGETLKLYTENPNSFFANRQKRYTHTNTNGNLI